jgi:crotonobetainyl-CoA:carnitine CoA-transferase CaiB-like acyl-CoA transferase
MEEVAYMGPLAGIRVLDISQVMAGPYCCMLLGDMGADVIKIEPPGVGDSTRKSMGFRLKGEDSPGFLALNRNKRSIALDLKSEEDREILYALVRTADVLVENGRPGVAGRLKMDYETIKAINPKIIYTSISGFGQSGPWALRPGFDLMAQAMSGVISATGTPEGDPVKSDVPIGDLGAALFAVYGILSAVIGRGRTGEGAFVDASLYEAALGLSIWETTEYWGTGKSPRPIGTANRMSAPYQAVKASDGYFVVGAANQKLWLSFLEVVGLPELATDPRFPDNKLRLENLEALMAVLNPVFLTRTVEEWVEAMLAAGVPAGPILDYAQALATEHTAARNMVQEIAHPIEGTFKALGFPVKVPGAQSVRHHPPLLNEHREEIVAELIRNGVLKAFDHAGA